MAIIIMELMKWKFHPHFRWGELTGREKYLYLSTYIVSTYMEYLGIHPRQIIASTSTR